MEVYHKEKFHCIVNNEGVCAIRSLLSLDLTLNVKLLFFYITSKFNTGNLGGQSSSLSGLFFFLHTHHFKQKGPWTE